MTIIDSILNITLKDHGDVLYEECIYAKQEYVKSTNNRDTLVKQGRDFTDCKVPRVMLVFELYLIICLKHLYCLNVFLNI